MKHYISEKIKLYHIVHLDNLKTVLEHRGLLCDAELRRRRILITTIGMNKIKRRRLEEIRVKTYPDLFVGDCVPFYFCPRSIMLYLIARGNHPELGYRGGQENIIHMVADFDKVVAWARMTGRRYVFTISNAGSYYLDDFTEKKDLCRINWQAVNSRYWKDCIEEKQAEFLLEYEFPFELVEKIGVFSHEQRQNVVKIFSENCLKSPEVTVERTWYY